jgi:hypothetical protein
VQKQDFNDKFNELLASLNRAMSKEYKEVWYKKVRDLNFEIFCKVVDRFVANAEKLPTLPHFFAEYYRIKRAEFGEAGRGCAYCRNGYVLIERMSWMHQTQIGVALRCARCNPSDKDRGYDPKLNPRGYKLGYLTSLDESKPSDPCYTAMESYRRVQEVVADIGKPVATQQTEEEKRLARRKALQKIADSEVEQFPYEHSDEIPF